MVHLSVDQTWETCCYIPYLAVWNGIKQLTDLCWFLDILFFRGQRVRGRQSIDSKHPVDVTEHDEVFLIWHQWDGMVKTALITVILHYTYYWGHEVERKSLPHSSQVQHRVLPGTQHRMQSLHSATSHSTTAGSPDYQTTKETAWRKSVTAMPRRTKHVEDISLQSCRPDCLTIHLHSWDVMSSIRHLWKEYLI